MDPSSAQHHHHHQEMSSQTLESMLVCTKAQQDKKPRPAEQALKCPRCDSINTKFCYYNNYSLTQPRYFCKSCRRYWTKGGTLRNVPVGGGCRKNRRSSSSSSSTSSSSKRGQDHPHPISLVTTNNPNPLTNLSYDSDISLAIARLQKHSNGQMGFDHHDVMLGSNPNHHSNNNNPHCDMLGSHGHHAAANSPGFFGFLENHNGFQNLYYNGNNNSSIGHLENGLGHEEMSMVPYEETSVKQEMCNGRDHQGESGRVLWGFPWQVGGEGNNNMNMVGDHDSGSGSGRHSGWNNGFGSSWHGLLNSAPLM